jgi:uncharacterized protein
MMTIALGLFALGLLAGVTSGLFGVGGGIMIVPALVWLFGFSHLQANGTSLVALLLPVGSLAAYQYYQNGFIGLGELKFGLILSVGLFLGGFFGAKWAPHVNIILLKRIFGLVLFFGALRLWFFDSK